MLVTSLWSVEVGGGGEGEQDGAGSQAGEADEEGGQDRARHPSSPAGPVLPPQLGRAARCAHHSCLASPPHSEVTADIAQH